MQENNNQHAIQSESAWTPWALPLALAFPERTWQESVPHGYMTVALSQKRAGFQKGNISPIVSSIVSPRFLGIRYTYN